ncbi:hypothetical protein JM654_01245 [Microbacterium oxydans]|nr:hypothetical protein [Microbacterium oxydans]
MTVCPLVVYDEDELVFELPVVPCEQPHTDEVFFIYDVEDGEFPGDDALTETSWNGCYEAFQAYVGTLVRGLGARLLQLPADEGHVDPGGGPHRAVHPLQL